MLNGDQIRNNWIYILLSKPKNYLLNLIGNSLLIGCFTLAGTYLYLNSEYNTIKIPTITHSLITVAIGLLLVFRTQSAYERWSTASRNFYEIMTQIKFFSYKIIAVNATPVFQSKIKNAFKGYASNFMNYLRSENPNISHKFEKDYVHNLRQLIEVLDEERKEGKLDQSDCIFLDKIILDIMQASSSCARIKKHPIPMSYEMHIKISVFFYILSLPFGILYEMGLWSTIMVMITYYIIAGIEIISKEIENPFHGDPNDLPIEEYFDDIEKTASELKS